MVLPLIDEWIIALTLCFILIVALFIVTRTLARANQMIQELLRENRALAAICQVMLHKLEGERDEH